MGGSLTWLMWYDYHRSTPAPCQYGGTCKSAVKRLSFGLVRLLVRAASVRRLWRQGRHAQKHRPKVQCPLLVMVGTAEAQTMMAFHGLQPLLEKIAAAMDHVTFASNPGADHAYTHQRDYVWGVVSQWLEKVGGGRSDAGVRL